MKVTTDSWRANDVLANFPNGILKFTQVLSVVLVAIMGLGCSAFSLINAVSSDNHYVAALNIPYAENRRQRLDVYQPKSLKSAAPVVVFFYGGGWNKGSKSNYQFVAASLTRAGYVVVLPDYRVYPDVTFPEFVTDSALAVEWVAKNAVRFQADPNQIYLMGHSAGAHIAALLALDRRFLDAAGVPGQDIAGFIGLSGPYDFLPLKQGYLNDVFPVESRGDSQPIDFVTAAAPPTLLIHGADDTVVWPENSKRLANKLDGFDVPVSLKIYEDLGHASIAVALARPLDFIAMTIDDVVEFIESEKSSLLHAVTP